MSMKQVNIHYAKTHLSNLLHDVEEGTVVVIAKAGTPVAKIVPYRGPNSKRVLGLDKGKFIVPEDFDEPSSDIEQLFYGVDRDS
ncbi:MAG TPA: type II toxin-antitoxin system Phd/YefM family antitoxin [Myxococcota bacterium]|nr:type II toxin-antitoxin system Phd/YefM family antitoxin [Myxococcota bacterium]